MDYLVTKGQDGEGLESGVKGIWRAEMGAFMFDVAICS
jgi:hypothetical protein